MHGVGHSMGGVVLRVALAHAESIVPGRVVAIATPFLGTRVAEVVCQHRVAPASRARRCAI
jgi:alpha-beta hydrolase superfamily lysophospholipase